MGARRLARASRPPTCCTSRSTSSRSPARPAAASPRVGNAGDPVGGRLGGVARRRVGGRLLLRRARARGQPRREPARAARQPRLPDRRHAPGGARRGRDRGDPRSDAPILGRDVRRARGDGGQRRDLPQPLVVEGPTRTAPCSRRAGSSRRCACRGRVAHLRRAVRAAHDDRPGADRLAGRCGAAHRSPSSRCSASPTAATRSRSRSPSPASCPSSVG